MVKPAPDLSLFDLSGARRSSPARAAASAVPSPKGSPAPERTSRSPPAPGPLSPRRPVPSRARPPRGPRRARRRRPGGDRCGHRRRRRRARRARHPRQQCRDRGGPPSLDVDEALWDRILDTNLKGAFFAARAAARLMRDARRGGAILNLCSLTSEVGVPTAVPYGSSKSGLLGMTRALAAEWAPLASASTRSSPAISAPP